MLIQSPALGPGQTCRAASPYSVADLVSLPPQVALSKDGVMEVHGLGTLSDVEKAGLEVTVAICSSGSYASVSLVQHARPDVSMVATDEHALTQGLKPELQGSIQKGIDFVAKRS